MIRARTVSLLVVVVVAIAGLGVVILRLRGDSGAASILPWSHSSSDSTSAYCNAVSADQAQIGALATSGDAQTALIDGLPLFESLATNAPADISGSWTALNTAIAGLKSAIAATGHQPTDFSNGAFPKGLSAAQRTAVVDAADTLGSSATSSALTAIVQEVRDVCQVDLDL